MFISSIALFTIVLVVDSARLEKVSHPGHNGWWQLIPFYLMELIFYKGYKGANEYGENPKARLNNKIVL